MGDNNRNDIFICKSIPKCEQQCMHSNVFIISVRFLDFSVFLSNYFLFLFFRIILFIEWNISDYFHVFSFFIYVLRGFPYVVEEIANSWYPETVKTP